jgi:Family of unknown function (DUF5989)
MPEGSPITHLSVLIVRSCPLPQARKGRGCNYGRGRIRLDSLDPIRLSGRRGRGAGAGVSLATNNFLRFLRERRRYWIVPITIMVAVFVIFFLVAQGAKLLPVILAWF